MRSLEFAEFLVRERFALFTGVPDSSLRGFCSVLDELEGVDHLPAACEGAAVAVAAGRFLATGRPAVVYLQNSGLWNALNPYFSLTHASVYDIPILFVVGWRGRPGTKDEPQHSATGAATETVIRLMGIEPFVLDAWNVEVAVSLANYLEPVCAGKLSGAILVPTGVLNDSSASALIVRKSAYLTREHVVSHVLAEVGNDDLVVAGIGHTSRQVYAARTNSPDSVHLSDFYCIGGMGYALEVALGVASARPRRKIWVLEGDGSFLMHLGGKAGISRFKSSPLTYILLDNGAHASVGGQRVVSDYVDCCEAGRALGFSKVEKCTTSDELLEALVSSVSGSRLLWVPIINEPNLDLPRPEADLLCRKRAVMGLLGRRTD